MRSIACVTCLGLSLTAIACSKSNNLVLGRVTMWFADADSPAKEVAP